MRNSEFGNGPWQDEPDRDQWIDEATGLRCYAVRHPDMGHWCGYVAVPQAHPWFGLGYSEEDDEGREPELHIEVHGGITYADTGKFLGTENGSEDWLFGFDCAHAGDYVPGLGSSALMRSKEDNYRTLQFVRDECARLARQLQGIAQPELVSH
jgi:hypothetical protein